MAKFFVGGFDGAGKKVQELFLFAYVDCALALTTLSSLNLKEVTLDVEKYLKTFTSADSALVRAIMLLPSLKRKRNRLAKEARNAAKAATKAANEAKKAADEAKRLADGAEDGGNAADDGDNDMDDSDFEDLDAEATQGIQSGATTTTSGGQKMPGVKKGQLSIDKEWPIFELYWKLEKKLREKEDTPVGTTGQDGSDNEDEEVAALDPKDPLDSTKADIMTWYDAAIKNIKEKRETNKGITGMTVMVDPQQVQRPVKVAIIDDDFYDDVLDKASV